MDFFSVRLFVGSAWSFGFFIPATTANDLRLGRISIPDLIHYIFSPILNFIYFARIMKQVIKLILIMLVGTDVYVWMVFVHWNDLLLLILCFHYNN